MSNAQVKRAIANLHWVHGVTDKLTQGWPADKLTYQGSKTDNHLMWTIGHLACTYDWFRTLIDGKEFSMPANYQGLFGYGSKPTPSVADYPSEAEVRAAFHRSYQGLIAAAEAMTDADAAKPCLGDSHGLASDRLMCLERAAWHDGWHSGQLASMRKALGLPSVIG